MLDCEFIFVLKYLDLSNCHFEQNITFEASSNEILSLKFNNVRIGHFPETIRNLINLEHLDLSNNPDLSIQNNIFSLKKLKTLNLAYSKLDSGSLNFELLKNLVCLNISSLALTNIPDSIKNLVELKKLEIGHNKIEKITSYFYNLKNLSYLDLSNNKISFLSEDISRLKKLKFINLNFNNITLLPRSISNLEDLRSLSMINNRLESLPASFNKLVKLESLILTNNKLEKFPQEIKSLKNIKKLYISDNPIEDLYEIFYLNLSIDKKISLKEAHLDNIYSFKHTLFKDFKNLVVLIGTNNSGKSNLFKTFLNIKPFNLFPKEALFSNTSLIQAEIKLIFELSDEFLYNYIETMKKFYPKLRFVDLDNLTIVYDNKNVYWKTFLKILIVKLKFNHQMAYVDQFGFQAENSFLDLISYKNEIKDVNTDIKILNIVWDNINFKHGNAFLNIFRENLNEVELRVFNIDSKKEIKAQIKQHFTNFSVSFFFREFIEFYENIKYIGEFRNFQEETDGDLNPQEIISNGGNFPIIIADYCYNIQKNRDFIQFLLNKLYPDVKHLWTEYRGKSKKPFILEFNDMRRTFNNVGKGMHQILIILTHLIQLKENSTLFIEEPELYIHPELQKKLLDIIRKFLPLHQVFITSHSPFYINSFNETQSIHEIQKVNGVSSVKNVNSENISEVFNRLGLEPSDLLMYNGLILVEGKTDIFLLKKLMSDFLIDNHIEIISIEGKYKLHFFADHKILSNLIRMGFKFLIILDHDERNQKILETITDPEVMKHILLLPVREIENLYLNPNLIIDFIGERSSKKRSKPQLEECIIEIIDNVITKNLVTKLIRKSFLDKVPFPFHYNDKYKILSVNKNDDDWLNNFYTYFQSKYWIEGFNKDNYKKLFEESKFYYENINNHEKWKIFPGKEIRPLIIKELEETFKISIPLEKLEEKMKDNTLIKRDLIDKIRKHFGFLKKIL
ncbi:hypothetical protein LCGC14_1549390 [marine sediment metagenome]|uniref:Uncharacterized protein n=1 Tax=marine sediment metagenome TaxID=412755 RepID=A0A0F9IQS2_9ZZZZ